MADSFGIQDGDPKTESSYISGIKAAISGLINSSLVKFERQIPFIKLLYIFTSDKGGGKCVRPRLSVC